MVSMGDLSLLHRSLLVRSQAVHVQLSSSMRLGLEVRQLESRPVSSRSLLLVTLLSANPVLRWLGTMPRQLAVTDLFLFISILKAEGRMLLQP